MRILLHGGYPGHWDHAGDDRDLFQKLIDAAEREDGKVMVSICSYETPDKFPCLEQLKNTFHDMNPNIELTIAGQHNFKELIPHHKVIFFQGGNADTQKQFMDTMETPLFTVGKSLLAGSSSGAMLLCKHSYIRKNNSIFEGKGLADLAFIPHANTWPVQEYLPVLQKATSRSILLLNEMQMIEIEC